MHVLLETHQLDADTHIAIGAPCCSVTDAFEQGNNSNELALNSKPAKLQEWATDAHLLLNRVVLPDIGLDLLHNWPVLNLGESLGITDGSLSSRRGGRLQLAHKLVSMMQGTTDHQQCSAQKGY